MRTGRFMASRVLALVEHPANETQAREDDERPDQGEAGPVADQLPLQAAAG